MLGLLLKHARLLRRIRIHGWPGFRVSLFVFIVYMAHLKKNRFAPRLERPDGGAFWK
jgi:hypothetical protein